MDSLLINIEPVDITVISQDGLLMHLARMGIYSAIRKNDEHTIYNLKGEEIGFWFKNALDSESIWSVVDIRFIRDFQIKEMFNSYVY